MTVAAVAALYLTPDGVRAFWMLAWLHGAAWLAAFRCRCGRHEWTSTTLQESGVAVAIPHCGRCTKVDADRIVSTVWNRSARRRMRKTKLAREIRRGRRRTTHGG